MMAARSPAAGASCRLPAPGAGLIRAAAGGAGGRLLVRRPAARLVRVAAQASRGKKQQQPKAKPPATPAAPPPAQPARAAEPAVAAAASAVAEAPATAAAAAPAPLPSLIWTPRPGAGIGFGAADEPPAAAAASPAASTTGGSATPAPAPGAPTRDAVMGACLNSSVVLLALGAAAREGSARAAGAGLLPGLIHDFHRDVAWLLPPPGEHLALTAAAAVAVTLARWGLMAAWPAFRDESDASNRRVLPVLVSADLLFVSLLPAWGEEMLFRGALQPALGADAKAAVGAGLIFGLLHLGGGRGPAFAVWASLVGSLYGGLALTTQDLWVPVAAHGLANLASALSWQAGEAARKGQQAKAPHG